jgi:hypothetical protein
MSEELSLLSAQVAVRWDVIWQGLRVKEGTEEIQVCGKKGRIIMEVLNFIIAIVALVVAVLAFQRTGGTKDLRRSTAELLAKMEKKVREEEAAKLEKGKTQK